MELENPWRPVGLFVAFLLALAGDVALAVGAPLLPVVVALGVSGAALTYAVLKRYGLERVASEDIRALPELAQLQFLAHLYCLDERGDTAELRTRLCGFSDAHRDRVFVWVAPPSIQRFARRLSGLPRPPARRRVPAPLRRVRKLRSLDREPVVGSETAPTASPAKLPAVSAPHGRRKRRLKRSVSALPRTAVVVLSGEMAPCPVCGVTVSGQERRCPYCGADMAVELRL